jgi:hypothetical protein
MSIRCPRIAAETAPVVVGQVYYALLNFTQLNLFHHINNIEKSKVVSFERLSRFCSGSLATDGEFVAAVMCPVALGTVEVCCAVVSHNHIRDRPSFKFIHVDAGLHLWSYGRRWTLVL